MDKEHIHICFLDTVPRSNLYYYQGNFFHPVELSGKFVGIVKGEIRKFMRANKEMVERDRKDPNYKTLVQLFEEQYPGE